MEHTCKELPEECWDLILNRLLIKFDYGDHPAVYYKYHDLQAPSLVCKQFLSITNRIRRQLLASRRFLYEYNCEALFRALQRFTNLKEIVLYTPNPELGIMVGNINFIIQNIASSGLDLHSFSVQMMGSINHLPSPESFRILGSTMNNLKSFSYRQEAKYFENQDLVSIANAFPYLEELSIQQFSKLEFSNMVIDDGMEIVSQKLPGLRKIDITGMTGCTDRSLIALSSNCKLLQEIRCCRCSVSEYGICFALRRCRNLISLEAGGYAYKYAVGWLTLENSIIYATSLRVLDFNVNQNQERHLHCIAKAGIPLEKMVIAGDVSFSALETFLCACSKSLKHLELEYLSFLDDHSMRYLCKYLSNLVSIKLCNCSNLTTATLFILAKQCPVLSKIEMSHVMLEVEEEDNNEVEEEDDEVEEEDDDDDVYMDLERNYLIQCLHFICNQHLNDELLKKIGYVCPNLQTLIICGCDRVTTEGVGEVMKCCSQIKYPWVF